MKSYNFDIDILYNFLQSYGSNITRNGVIHMITLLKSGSKSNRHKIMFDYGTDIIEYLIEYFKIEQKYEFCQILKDSIIKHKEITE